jgi:hypothetical protein
MKPRELVVGNINSTGFRTTTTTEFRFLPIARKDLWPMRHPTNANVPYGPTYIPRTVHIGLADNK